MTAATLFYIIVSIFVIEHLLDEFIDYKNAKNFSAPIPKELEGVYNEESYVKSQNYNAETYRFGVFSSWFSFVLTLIFLLCDGFAYIDEFIRQYSDNEIILSLLFFGIIMIVTNLIGLPFSYYGTFVIEEKYDFNKSTRKLFFMDFIKGQFVSILLGGIILVAIVWFYQLTKSDFWLYAWGLISGFTILMTFLYTKLFVPLFNKQTPLEEGALRDAIENYAKSVDFQLKNIYVIDGSKRSTKANAYFSGFGKTKQITLYNTLINDLTTDEIVAVLAHEVGHYKRNHIIYNIAISTLQTGFTLFILSLFIENPIISEALGVKTHSFYIGIVAFGLLYSPISTITDLFQNALSRKFEYQADDYAKETTHQPNHLISALKKLSKDSLSNLTPHSWYVFFNYSHPTLLQRVRNLKK